MKKLAQILILTGQAELSIEQDRQFLGKNQEFEPYASFQRIDRRG